MRGRTSKKHYRNWDKRVPTAYCALRSFVGEIFYAITSIPDRSMTQLLRTRSKLHIFAKYGLKTNVIKYLELY